MLIKKILHKNYTVNRKFYQLKLPFDIDDMDLTALYSTYSKIR